MERHYKYKEIITMTFSQIHNSIKARLPLTVQFLIERIHETAIDSMSGHLANLAETIRLPTLGKPDVDS